VAQRIANEVSDAQRPGGEGLSQFLAERHVWPVDYLGWKRIDAAEVAGAGEQRCRRKFTRAEMLEAAQNEPIARPA
jgi:hypothetical protein